MCLKCGKVLSCSSSANRHYNLTHQINQPANCFICSKKFKNKEEDKLKNVFEALTLIDHPNIVKFHRFWTDDGTFNEKSGQKDPPRLVFITEYMSSGSLKQFLRKTKKSSRGKKIQVQSWKRWCTQILSALNYLHVTCDPPILHGNLTCDTIFIQHNGLVKIGSVAPDIIHQNVKTCRDNIVRNRHFLAPEWGTSPEATLHTAIDIFAFGMCALETAALELLPANPPNSSANAGSASNGPKDPKESNGHQNGNGTLDSEGGVVTEESIQRTIDSLEDEMQKDFIRRCLRKDPADRPTARELLFHPVLFEVHSLKLLAAHILVNTPEVDTTPMNETMTDEAIQTHYGRDTVMANVRRRTDGKIIEYKLSDFPVAEKLEKFMEDVKYGIYPLTAFALSQPPPAKTRAVTPEGPKESSQSVTPEPQEPEDRWGIEFKCYIGPPVPATPNHLTVLTKLCDGMNRQMQAHLALEDTPEMVAIELLEHAIINWRDVPSIAKLMTMGFIQRANETAEYLATNAEKNTLGSPDDNLNFPGGGNVSEMANQHQPIAAGIPDEIEKKPPTASVQVQAPSVPTVAPNAEEVNSASISTSGEPVQQTVPEEQDDSDVLEDPTAPQPLEGRLAGLEPVIGSPQMTLGEAVGAGTTHGGLHFPQDKFKFTGEVAKQEERLEAEIKEWQTRMQEYLVEAAKQQQQQQNSSEQSQQNVQQQQPPQHQLQQSAQNGAQNNEVMEDQPNEDHPVEDHRSPPAVVARSSSQQRES